VPTGMQPKLGAQSSCCQELAPVHGAHASMTLAEASPEGASAVCVLDTTLERFRGELLRAGHRSAATLDLCSRGAQASSLCNQIAQLRIARRATGLHDGSRAVAGLSRFN